MMDQIELHVQPPHLYPEYKSTILRSPTKPLMIVKEYLKDLSLPAFGESVIGKFDNDLTKNARKMVNQLVNASKFQVK
jgi:protocatechuate 3,4-dioxygenase beta subunit